MNLGKLVVLAAGYPDARFIFCAYSPSEFLIIDGMKKYSWYKQNIWPYLSAIVPVLGESPGEGWRRGECF